MKKNPFAKPDTDGEKAAAELIWYVNIVAEHIPGSMGDVQNMRHELFSIVNTDGMPHIFTTLNVSETNSPIAAVLAGRDIDLDKFFDNLSPGAENLERAKLLAQNPVAAAQFFDISVQNLLGILLGTHRNGKVGLFGEIGVYYGVVEAQGRGTLHIHLIIWLKNGLSPLEIKQKIESDPLFSEQLLAWYDDIVSQNMPESTRSYENPSDGYKRQPVMSRPPDPEGVNFEQSFAQDLRNVLENTAHIHEHSGTCYKHLPLNLKSLRDDDKDCRFHLPRPTVERSHFDDEKNVVLRCNDGRVNGHTPCIVTSQRCNMDTKPIGSGTMAMVAFQYVGNYTAKFTMDTAFVFAALCSAIKILSEKPPLNLEGVVDEDKRSRQLMVKTVNKLVGKHELSSQQVASSLIGTPSMYTNQDYPKFFWSGMLRELAREVFVSNHDRVAPTCDGEDNELPNDGEQSTENPTISAGDDSYIILSQRTLGKDSNNSEQGDNRNRLFSDFFYRPEELQDMCAWDIMIGYSKERVPSSKTQRKTYLCFQAGHPQYATHCLKQLSDTDRPRVPVLVGYKIPRSDREEELQKYAVVILALFKPWTTEIDSPLKSTTETWEDALTVWSAHIPKYIQQYIDNMQLLHQSKDAKDDYSAQRRKRINELSSQFGTGTGASALVT